MIKSYSASRTHKLLLNFKPSPDCCLSGIALNDLKNLSKMIVFIWLRNKNGYWFHINSVRGSFVDGYALIQSQSRSISASYPSEWGMPLSQQSETRPMRNTIPKGKYLQQEPQTESASRWGSKGHRLQSLFTAQDMIKYRQESHPPPAKQYPEYRFNRGSNTAISLFWKIPKSPFDTFEITTIM